MNVIVVGCGRVGAELAYRLFQKGNSVVVIDQTGAAFRNLPADFRGRTVEGEVLSQNVLRQAGIEEADGLAAVTSKDTLNMVVAYLARVEYHVPIVVIRNYDPNMRAISEAFDLQIVSSSSWGAQRIEELLYQQQTRTVFSAGNGEVELYEFTIPNEWEGHNLYNMIASNECVLVAVTRAGRAMMPNCDLRLEKGDLVLISATLEGTEALRRKLNHAPDKLKA